MMACQETRIGDEDAVDIIMISCSDATTGAVYSIAVRIVPNIPKEKEIVPKCHQDRLGSISRLTCQEGR